MIERLYLGLYGIWRRAMGAADVAFTGFWLGVLSRATLHRVDDLMYRRRTRYRGAAHNLGGLFAWEEAALQPYLTVPRRVAVIGAGGGREVIALCRRGCEVEGFECNQGLVEASEGLLRQAGVDASIEWLPRDAVPSDRPPYSLVVIGWSAYALIQGRASRVALLRDLASITRPGTPILISFFSRSPLEPRLERIHRVGGLLRRALRRAPPELGDDLSPNFVHRFTRDEIAAEAAEAGTTLAIHRDEGTGPTDAGHAVLLSGGTG